MRRCGSVTTTTTTTDDDDDDDARDDTRARALDRSSVVVAHVHCVRSQSIAVDCVLECSRQRDRS
jgi:hypothetical protein